MFAAKNPNRSFWAQQLVNAGHKEIVLTGISSVLMASLPFYEKNG